MFLKVLINIIDNILLINRNIYMIENILLKFN